MKRKSSSYEVRPWPSVSSFELLFEPLYAVGPEGSGKRVSPYEMMLRREYRLAMEGNLASQRVILKVLRGNERARAVRDRRGTRIAFEEYRYPPCDYDAVLRLLGIAVRIDPPERYNIDKFGRRVPDLARRDDDPTLRLNRWAFDLAVERRNLVDEEKRDGLAKCVLPAGEESDSPVIIEPDPPKRDPKDTRFQKGKSGNPRGRPRKAEKLDPLPFETFLDEKVPARINGELRQITRLEALLFQMQKRAAEGYSGTARLLLGLCLAELEARWKRKEHVMPIVRHERESDVDTPFLRGLVEMKIINRRRQGFVMLEPWIVEAAVTRLERELTEIEQIVVVRATTNPRKVDWPQWWLPHLREKAPPGPVKASYMSASGW